MKNPTNKAFDLIHDEITQLRERLDAKDICPCCVGRALLYRGALVLGDHTSDDETMELCDDVVDMIEGEPRAGNTAH